MIAETNDVKQVDKNTIYSKSVLSTSHFLSAFVFVSIIITIQVDGENLYTKHLSVYQNGLDS